jgi:predicted DNA-binding transcriptional regulator AlpA
MNSEDSLVPSRASPEVHSRSVALSPWINEHFPPWHEILTAHDVARLTRRHQWEVCALALVGRFPRKRRFRGRSIGWSRSDVLAWLTKNLRTARGPLNAGVGGVRVARHGSLPLGFTLPHVHRRRRRMRCASGRAQRYRVPTLAFNPSTAGKAGPEVRS